MPAVPGKRHHDENFPVASRLVRPALRPPILAFYRFARAADDVADQPGAAPAAKLARLARMEAGLLGQEDGPPELLFMHGGHTNHLADFSWNLNDPWLVASAAEDNLLQIWKVAESIVSQEEVDMPMNELEAST